MSSKLKKMNIAVMRDILQHVIHNGERNFMINEDFGIVHGDNTILKNMLSINKSAPFMIEDYRIVYIIKGEIHATINLIDRHIKAGEMIFIGRGSIVQVDNISNDFCGKGFVISQNLMNRIFSDQLPDIINQAVQTQVFETSAADIEFIDDINNTIYHLLSHKHVCDKVLHGLLLSLIFYINDKYMDTENMINYSNSSNRNHEIFSHFISLVNKYAARERAIKFYADKLFLTPRYLSTVVSQHSGQTCKEWIDQATINHAKVMLCHTDKSISQIADSLKFTNDSFFCKYFRRLTGLSPTEYRITT